MRTDGNQPGPNDQDRGESLDVQQGAGGIIVVRSVRSLSSGFTEHIHIADAHLPWLRDAIDKYLRLNEGSTDEVAVT